MFTLSIKPKISLHLNHVTNPSGLISRAQCLTWLVGTVDGTTQNCRALLCDSGAQTLALNLQRKVSL